MTSIHEEQGVHMGEWHALDVEAGYEVRRVAGVYQVRSFEQDQVTELTAEEFDQLRRPGPNPKGLR